MAENTMTDKITETITNAFKNSKVFEKIGRFEIYISSFLLTTTLIGVTSIAINILNVINIDTVKKYIEENDNVLKYQFEINRQRNLIDHCNLKSEISLLHNKIVILLEHQEKLINQLEEIKLIQKSYENNLSINISKIDCISSTASIKTFSPIKPMIEEEKELTYHDKEDDELLNECYDIIPLNNVKKHTGLSWLFE